MQLQVTIDHRLKTIRNILGSITNFNFKQFPIPNETFHISFNFASDMHIIDKFYIHVRKLCRWFEVLRVFRQHFFGCLIRKRLPHLTSKTPTNPFRRDSNFP